MKIVHCIYCMGIGGAQTMLVDIVNEQAKLNEVHLVIINLYYNNELLKEISSDIKIHKINRKEGSRNIIDVLKLNLLLSIIKPEIVHSHDDSIVKWIFSKKIFKCLTIHDTGLNGNYYNKYNKLIAISTSVQKDVQTRTGFSPEIVPNGIIFNRIRFKTNQHDEKNFRIIQVSRLSLPKKGQDILICALSLLNKKGFNNIYLDLIGYGESEKEIKDLVYEKGVQDYVRFLGLKHRKYIYDNLCEYNLLVQPSRNEGFGLTVAEAIAAKLPVLVSDIEGPMEIIENGKYGFFFKNESVVDCANIIEGIYNKLYLTDVEENRRNIIHKYDISIIANRYYEIYNN